MEDFRNIADETFPSYLGQSLNSSASVLFENVTVSSNPGLPVAASTVARSQEGGDNSEKALFVGDDIDDEEFDNKLEAYFEQLIQPEIRRDTNLQNLSECCAALKLSENVLLKVGLKFKARHAQWLLNIIVYQNEEGKWVTDLAYYTAFDEEQDLNMSEGDKRNEEFITGSEAAAMIAQDQEEFEKAHRLILNASELANTSWRSANSFILPRTSDLHKDASYLRLSLGEFFGQRSEALGCLGGGSDVKRPSFGYYITSPKKRQPVPLLMRSDSSGGDIGREISQLSEVFSGTYGTALFFCGALREHMYPRMQVFRQFLYCKLIPFFFLMLLLDDLEAQRKKHANFTSSGGKFEDSLSNHSDSVLSISTIANAIANASSSAEPSQLAAMMMALSNKSKRTRVLPGAVKEAELSANEALSSNEENSEFDMEKYLKKTDENRCESEYESVMKHEASLRNLTSDTFLVGKDKHKDAFAEDWINNHSKQQGIEKRLLDYLNEESDSQNFSSLSGIPKHKPVLPECDLNLEGEQCSFRPSTSPLIHSSPMLHEDYAGELSTTIIQASPVPLQEDRKENLEDRLRQRSRKKAILSIDQEQEENELAGLQRKPHNILDQELAKEGFLRINQVPFIPSNVPPNHEELDHVKSALPSKLCTFPPLSVNVDVQELCQDQTNKAQRQGLPSQNVLPVYSGLNTCLPCKNSSGEQHVHISTVKSHVTTSESQAISSSVPTLLTGHCLATTPFAKQHLGTKQPAGNAVLSQFHGCSAAGFGLPAGLPCSGIPGGHVENPLMLGIPLGANIGPGFLGAASLYNPHGTSWNNNILNIKPCTGQPLGAGGRDIFSSKGHIKVPEELKFPNACCVGIASQTVLSVYNPTDRWLQVNIGILSVSVNGERMDPVKYQCLVFKNKTIVGPYSANDLKILFLPSRSGIFQCILNVSSWPVSADAETIIQSEALASRVVLTAVAENPNLEVESGKGDCLDFGDLPFGNLKALPLKLINKTHAFMPIRLIINANAVAWRCFTFSKEPVNTSNEQMDAVSQTAAPSVVNHVIHASCDGQDPEALTVWVLFHAPKKQISSSDSLGPAEEFLARVDVEVDSPGPSTVIKSIFLRARAGTARICIPKDLKKIHLSASVGSTVKQQLSLVNSGNISVHLKVQDSSFAVKPEDLFLFPGEEQVVTVQFFPKSTTTTESILKILVLPSGPQFEVMIEGEVESGQNRPVSTAAGCSDIPPILSNKQFIAWGAVSLGSSVQKKLILRNDSPSVTQHLRLLIRGQDQDSFQLQSIFGSEQRLTSSWELRMRPKEDTNIYLMFTPTRVTCCFAKLEIKQLGIQSKPGIKFTIPLSGYGGTSNIILENVKKLSDSFLVTLEGSLSARSQEASFHVRNTGSRAAYVKVLCLGNLQTKAAMDPQVMRVSPEQFVLREGTHEVITVTWNPMEKNFSPSMVVSTLCLFWGDEVSRQQYRRISLLLSFLVCDVPRETNDIHLFYANMQKVLLSVVGYSTCDQDGFQLENFVTHTAATLDVLPVKGPQGISLSAKNNDLAQNKSDSQETWAVTPEYLILTSPTLGKRVQILNNSNRMLAFELSWPAHCLTVTPQHGDVEPGTLILVSPNPSLATRPILIPWSGLIYIHCDNGLKFIKVLIQEAVTQSMSGSDFPCRRCDIITPQSENPTVDVPKPLPRFPLTEMDIKNRNIVFPKTRPGQSSENYLEMENKGNENLKWKISSFAPPYIKGVDGSGTVYRVPYSAFEFSHVSGTLEVHGQEKVAVIFSPRDKGDYSQFWDLEYYSVGNPSRKHKLKFQLSGNSTKAENETPVVKSSPSALKKTELAVTPERKAYSEGRPKRIRQKEVIQGVYAPEDVYVFPLTRVGEACTLKVHLRNNSRTTHVLKFVSPREPFYIRHLKYSLRSCHYIAVPVQFKPKVEGMFEDVFVVLTSKYGPIKIRLYGKAIAKK
uniref:Centrosomal protein 192 n=1 Tax=Geospiza parvula TaxID=87175 RepID=A0A8U8B7I1_GEOPR